MRRVWINSIAAILGLSVGLGVHSLVRRFFTPQFDSPFTVRSEVKRITIESVPDADFPVALKRRRPTQARVTMIAQFNADGSIKSVSPYPTIPFDTSAWPARFGEYIGPFVFDGREVGSLPYGLARLAIEQVSRINYKPGIVDGLPASQKVFVSIDYNYAESAWAKGCSTIDVRLSDDTGVLWQGNTWVGRNIDCEKLIR